MAPIRVPRIRPPFQLLRATHPVPPTPPAPIRVPPIRRAQSSGENSGGDRNRRHNRVVFFQCQSALISPSLELVACSLAVSASSLEERARPAAKAEWKPAQADCEWILAREAVRSRIQEGSRALELPAEQHLTPEGPPPTCACPKRLLTSIVTRWSYSARIRSLSGRLRPLIRIPSSQRGRPTQIRMSCIWSTGPQLRSRSCQKRLSWGPRSWIALFLRFYMAGV